MAKLAETATGVRVKTLNQDVFLFDLHHADWSTIYSMATVSEKWGGFLSIFMPILDKHAPMRSVRGRR